MGVSDVFRLGIPEGGGSNGEGPVPPAFKKVFVSFY